MKNQPMQTTFGKSGQLTKYTTKLDSHRIHGKNRLEKFLEGTKDCKVVAYVMSLDFIEQYIEEIGIEKLTVILGKEFSISTIKSMDPSSIEKLAAWQKEGILSIRKPDSGIWHEKMFFCWNREEGWFMDLNGSANPTKSGSGGAGQSNRITTVKIEGDYETDEYYQKCMEQWEYYEKRSSPFLGSLFDALPQEREEWRNVIIRYIESDGDLNIEDVSEIRVLRQKMGQGLFESSVKGEQIFSMSIEGYREASVNKVMERWDTMGLDPKPDGDLIRAPSAGLDLLSPIKDTLPFMSIVDGKIWVRVGGRNYCRTSENLPKEEISKSLKEIENYVESLSAAHRGDKKAKMALAEFLLACCIAPFDHMYMKKRRSLLPRLKEGPRMTSYYGIAGNGKSYSCRYALKMLTGLDVDPLGTSHFTKNKVLGAAASGSIFPLIFDDLHRNRIREWEKWGKFYWDSGYDYDSPYPQLILTSNDRFDSNGPLGRRAREISMHATFSSTEENSFTVESLLRTNTDFFLFFSKIIMDEIQSEEWNYSHSDELSLGRWALNKMYSISGMKMAEWWPEQPVEKVHDDHAYQWLDLINKDICSVKIERDELVMDFGNISPHDVKDYSRLIDSSAAAEHVGTRIRIRNPSQFLDWINDVRQVYSLPIKRKVKRLLKKKFS